LYQIELFLFELNRYQIEIKSNRRVSATSWSKIESNWNQFDLTALDFPQYTCVASST
jgi:hypothetical protein